jgi:hypothetical protein
LGDRTEGALERRRALYGGIKILRDGLDLSILSLCKVSIYNWRVTPRR